MYYQGDYYSGDYYQGDPGLFGFIGRTIKKGFRAASGLVGTVLPGPGGAIARRVSGALAPSRPLRPAPPSARLAPPPPRITAEVEQFRGYRASVNGKAARVGMDASGCCPTGYHPVKSGEGYCVRNRSINVANPRALRRGLRRVAGFAKLARRARTDIRRAARAVR